MGLKRKVLKMVNYFRKKRVVSIPAVVGNDTMLEGKTVFITGGSGGIGMAMARKMLSVGANVILSGTKEEKLKKCVNELGYPPERLQYLVLNLSDVGSFQAKCEEAAKLFPRPINVLINSAGVIGKHSFLETTEKEFDDVFNVNVKGTFFISQAFAKYFIENHVKGKILNVSSSSALRPAWGPYQMSKWAIRGFTVGLADKLLPHDIVVNAIAPGPTATSMLGKQDREDLSLPSSPIGRYTTPEEIAELAAVLVSDLGNIVIGDTLYATGGSGVTTLHR